MIHPAPPGFTVKGTSTLYDMQTGQARVQWVKTKQDGSDEALQAIIDGLKDEVPDANRHHAQKQTLKTYWSAIPSVITMSGCWRTPKKRRPITT